MINIKENNRIETVERFINNGFIESSKKSNSNEISFICHCSYSQEKYHEISVNLITGRYQSFNNGCEQKKDSIGFTKLYLSGYYQSNTIKTNREVTAPVNSENKSYTFNNEDKKTLEIIIKNSRFNKEVTEKLSKKRTVIYEGLNNNLPDTWGYYDKDIINNLIKEKIIKSNVVKRIGLLYSDKLNKFRVLVCNQDYSYYKAYNLEHNNTFENKVYNPYQIKKRIYNIEKIKPDKKICIYESTEKALSSEVTSNDNSIVCLGLHGIGTSLNDYLELFQDKEVYIIFDKRADKIKNTDIERKEALKRAIELSKVTKKVFISEIPYLNKDIDIDDYLELFPKDERKDKLNEVISNCFEPKIYKTLYQVNVKIPQDETRRIRKKRVTKRVENTSNKYETIKEIRANLTNKIGDSINNFQLLDYSKALFLSAGAGTGKTTCYLIALKDIVGLGGKHLYVTETTNLCNEVSRKALIHGVDSYQIKSNLSYCEINHEQNIKSLDEKEYKIKEDNSKTFNRVLRYKTRQENNYSTNEICKTCPLKSTCKNMIHRNEGYFKKDVPLYIMTLSKYKELIKSEEIRDYISNNLLSVTFDENISNMMIDKKELLYSKFNKITDTLEFYQSMNKLNQDQLKALEVLKEIYKDKSRFNNLESRDILKFYQIENKPLYNIINEIKIDNLDLEYNQDIDKNNIENKDKRISHIPKRILTDFISFLRSSRNNKFLIGTNKSLTMLKRNKFDKDLNLLYIFLDASTDISILSYLTGIKETEINHYNPKIKANNLKVYQIVDSTFSNQYFDKKSNLEKLGKFIDSKTKEDQISLISLNKDKNKLTNYVNIKNSILNYGKEKGVNDFENYDNNFLFNPSLDENMFNAEIKILFNVEPENTLEYKQTSILLDNNNYLEIENRVYTNKLVEKYNQLQRQDKIYQASNRIYRDYENSKEKSIYIFSDLDMSKYFDNIELLELEQISKVSDKRQEATKVFKDMILYSLNKYSIIPTDNFKKANINKIDLNNENLVTDNKLLKNENSNLVIAQLRKDAYVNSLYTYFALMQSDIKSNSNTIYSLDYIMTYLKENFNISDRTFDTIKKDVFSELSIKTYFLGTSKQGTFYTDNFELAKQIIDSYKTHQNKPLVDDIKTDSINTPIENISLNNDLKKPSLDNDFDTNVTNVIYKKAPVEIFNYDNYVKSNQSYLYDCLDKFITDKSLSGTLINDNDLSDLENKLNDSIDIDDSFKYEFLISDIVENLLAYNQQIKELIAFNNTNNQIISLKEKYDNYVSSNKSYLDKEVNDLINRIANQDRLIDNKLIDDLLSKAKFHLDNIDIEKSLYHQFLVFNLSENIDKYNLMINKIQVEKDKEPDKPKIDNSSSYTFIQNTKKHNTISFSQLEDLLSNDIEKSKLLHELELDIKNIPDIKEQMLMRKYISILIIQKINLNNQYFINLDKWVLNAVDVDEFINRQNTRDFIKEHKKALEKMIA